MARFVDGIKFITTYCCNCGMPFAITEDFYTRKKQDNQNFFCPNGHKLHYTSKSEAQNLKEQLVRSQEKLEAQAARARKAEAEKNQFKRNYKRMRERINNGVCPCCNRIFQNLLDHMRNEHPNFEEQEILRNLREAYGLTQAGLADEIGVTNVHISLYERQQPVAAWAQERIDSWMVSHNA